MDTIVAETVQQKEAEQKETTAAKLVPDEDRDEQNLWHPMKSYWSTLVQSYNQMSQCYASGYTQYYLPRRRKKRESREQRLCRRMG